MFTIVWLWCLCSQSKRKEKEKEKIAFNPHTLLFLSNVVLHKVFKETTKSNSSTYQLLLLLSNNNVAVDIPKHSVDAKRKEMWFGVNLGKIEW